MNKSWTILGSGDFTGEIIDNIEANQDYCRYIVLNDKSNKNVFKKIPRSIKIIDFDEFKPATDNYIFGHHSYGSGISLCPICINKEIKIYHRLNFGNLIHPTAWISKTTKMGKGNYFGTGVIIGSNTVIGDNNTFNRGVTVGHNDLIENHNNFSPASTICGNCFIGSQNYFGAGSTLIDKLTVKNNILVGAGAVIVDNLVKTGTYVGIPAKKKRKNIFLKILRKTLKIEQPL